MTISEYVKKIEVFSPRDGITVYLLRRPGTGFFHAACLVKSGASVSKDIHPMLPVLMSEMLDEGTKNRGRDALRRELESLGSQISFELGTENIIARIEGRSRALDDTFMLCADMLLHSSFSDSSFVSVRKRLIGESEEDKENTRNIAYANLTRLLYAPGSAYREELPTERIALLKKCSASHVRSHARSVLRGPLTIVIVGDASKAVVTKSLRKHFRSWNITPGSVSQLSIIPERTSKLRANARVPGKENVDVYFGIRTDVLSKDAEYVPLSVAAELLGSGGFTGHLMKTVRERDGLTYGIFARLRDVASTYPLFFVISATFGNALVKKGIVITKKEITLWLARHITSRSLKQKKKEIIGSYLVSLQDPEEVVSKLVSALSAGCSYAFLSEYPEQVKKLSLDEVKKIARLYIGKRLAMSNAGSAGVS